MPGKKQTEGQHAIDQYTLKQVDVRLKLRDGPAYYSNEPMSNPRAAVDVMKDVLAEMDREYVCVVNLDNKLAPINFNIVSIGGINTAPAPIQNIFKASILCNAANIMLFHCHPSGSVLPSKEDERLTEQLIKAGDIMEIPLLDHIIIGCGTRETYSFRENTCMFDTDFSLVSERNQTYGKNSVLDQLEERHPKIKNRSSKVKNQTER